MFEWEKESMAKKRRRKINKDIIKSAKKKKKKCKRTKGNGGFYVRYRWQLLNCERDVYA